MQLREAINYYFEAVEDEISAATIRTYKDATKSFLLFVGNIPLEDIKPQSIRKWGKSLEGQKTLYTGHPNHPEIEKGYSVFTIRRRMTSLRTVFNWFVEDELIAKTPFTKTVKIPSKPHPRERKLKAISNSDYYSMLRVAKNGMNNGQRADEYIKRNVAILTYFRSTGGRLGGLCSLTLENVINNDGNISCRVKEKGRNGGTWHVRHLSLGASFAMKKWLDVRQGGSDFVFYALRGDNAYKNIDPKSVYNLTRQLAKIVGIKGKFSPHSFRHAFAVESIKQGVELSVVSQLLGHATPAITYEVYGQLRNEDLKEQYRRATASWCDRGLVQ